MATSQSEEKTFIIYATEYNGWCVKAKSLREAIDIFEAADLLKDTDRVKFYECADFEIAGIRNGSEWIEYVDLEDKLEEEEEEEEEGDEEEE